MSKETAKWLNTQTLSGFTEKRGNAWHYRTDFQGDESNHYTGPIPVADVERRLFDWTPEAIPVTVQGRDRVYSDPNKIILGNPKTGALYGTFSKSGSYHAGFKTTLLDNVRTIVNDDLNVGSAGLLRNGAVGWVQIETEKTWFAPDGVEFRPFLFAADSLDGSLAVTYGTGNQLIVCDNTLAAATAEAGSTRIRFKHTTNSLARIQDARTALGIINEVGADFEAEVKALLAEKVPARRYNLWAEAYSGYAKVKDQPAGRGLTMATNKLDTLKTLWAKDERVAPWKGTAWGVLQAANTYEHHFAASRGASKYSRNMSRMVYGQVAEMDSTALKVLASVK